MRCLGLLVVMALALPACREAPVEPSLRARLGPPMVALAQTVDRAVEMADSARYRVERGEPMREALALLRGTLDEVRSDAGELAHAAIGVIDPQARALARQSVELALGAADAADEEIAALSALVDADALMDRTVASWTAAPDPALADEAASLAQQVAAAVAVPEPCRLLWDNRVRWAGLVAERTRRIAGAPAEAEAFLANPFGEDRRAADAADRSCWQRHGPLPRAEADLRPLVQHLSELTASRPVSRPA